MTRNGLFLISVGCILIVMSPTMATPYPLITSGIALIILALAFCRKKKPAKKYTK